MEYYKKNYDVKRIPRTEETPAEEKLRKPVSRIIITLKTLALLPIVASVIWVFGSFGHYQLGWKFPEIKAQTVYQVVDEETEEEALERRTEEILFENLQSYYDDAHKKALAEKVEALNDKIASTTTLTPEDTEALKKKLKRQERSL